MLNMQTEKLITYKGYSAAIACSEEDECFVGHIAAIRDVVGFHWNSERELREAFEEAVDDYLEVKRKAFE